MQLTEPEQIIFSTQEKDSTEDEEDYDEDRGGDEEDEEEKSFKEEMGKTKYQTEEEKDDSLVDDSPVPGSQDTSKEKQRGNLLNLEIKICLSREYFT